MPRLASTNDNPSVNRYLDDKALDHIDHALGRPAWPLRESYRNYFATSLDSEHARQFKASPHWTLRNVQGQMAWYSVTDDGRKALADHLAAQGLDRVYVVSYQGGHRNVAASTPSKARYSYYRELSDVLPDLTFVAFARRARVRLAA